MFTDLQDKDIQPLNINVKLLPEIELSERLKNKLQTLLKKEEDNFVKIYDRTAIVKIEKNYVFFSNHWLYLAVLCKKYAKALKPYADFFDEKIRGNQEVLKKLAKKDSTPDVLMTILPDEIDRERMFKFIKSDPDFRPGKCLINGEDASRIRTTKDIIGSCILKKLAVPDASSGYLGNLIFYLASDPNLYDELENEIWRQLGIANCMVKLSSTTKVCAKQIIDHIYKLDEFKKIEDLFENTGKSIRISAQNANNILPSNKCLRYLFALPGSEAYNNRNNGRVRIFTDKEYTLNVSGDTLLGMLSTEWKDCELTDTADGNVLAALIAVVNKYYEEFLEIKCKQGEYYLFMFKNEFFLSNLPDVFQTDFSRRFITSLLAKPFVILTGNSGTGKTRIAKKFAEYLEVQSEDGKKNWLIVPVGADWTDNSNILGFYNPLANNGAGRYEKTKIINLIERANAHTNIPYFLILDEMNLSHVEQYFADFLSHMEIPRSQFELDGYDGILEFPENLFVIGTVNIDETTYMFSPKVLDRANVIEFKPDKDTVLSLFTKPVANEKVLPAKNGSAEAFLKLAKDVKQRKNNDETEEINARLEDAEKIFSTIYDSLEKNGFEFAYRTVREIRQYLLAAYEISDKNTDFNFYDAIDEQLLQKILPKIHGNTKEIEHLLDTLEENCNIPDHTLKLSVQKIKQMKGKLDAVNYASFI